MSNAFQNHQDLASLKTVKLKTWTGKSKKKTGEYFLSSSSQILSHTTSLTLVKSNPIYECFLETSTLDPKIQRWISWMPQGVDEIPKY